MPWRLTIRTGPKVQHSRHSELAGALAELDQRAQELAASAPRRPVDARVRRFDPAEQVTARLELSGPERFLPRLWAGLDVRGDGSIEAYLGRMRRQLVKRRRNEAPLAALRRALEDADRSAG